MDISSWTSRNVRDCGTRVRQPHLASHLQNFEVKHKTTSPVSEEIQKCPAHGPPNKPDPQQIHPDGKVRSLGFKWQRMESIHQDAIRWVPKRSLSQATAGTFYIENHSFKLEK